MGKITIEYEFISHKKVEKIFVCDDFVEYYESTKGLIQKEEIQKDYEKNKIVINDKKYIEQMIFCNAYLPIKERLVEYHEMVKQISVEEFDITKNKATKILKVKDAEFVATFDMFIEQYKEVLDIFIYGVKNVINWYLNKDK